MWGIKIYVKHNQTQWKHCSPLCQMNTVLWKSIIQNNQCNVIWQYLCKPYILSLKRFRLDSFSTYFFIILYAAHDCSTSHLDDPNQNMKSQESLSKLAVCLRKEIIGHDIRRTKNNQWKVCNYILLRMCRIVVQCNDYQRSFMYALTNEVNLKLDKGTLYIRKPLPKYDIIARVFPSRAIARQNQDHNIYGLSINKYNTVVFKSELLCI